MRLLAGLDPLAPWELYRAGRHDNYLPGSHGMPMPFAYLLTKCVAPRMTY